MKYSEIFYTVQGEGELIGTPSVFFRTSFCNLRCWWCDTPYTSWEPEDKDISIDDAVEQIMDFGCKHIVITGGEPFIQEHDLGELCKELRKTRRDCHITIETNATVYHPVDADLISMSPKLKNSIPMAVDPKLRYWEKRHEKLMYNPVVIRKFRDKYRYQLKFVVDTDTDMEEIESMLDHIHNIELHRVWLMPQARTKEELRAKSEYLIDLCKAHGYRFSPRMHIDVWGTKRGV